MNRRFAAVIVPLLALGLAACSDDKADQPADPKAALIASTSGVDAGNYSASVAMPGGGAATAVVHAPSKSAALSTEAVVEEGQKGKVDILFVDPNRYVKMTMDMGESAAQLESLKELGQGDPESAKMLEGLQTMVDTFSGKTWMKLDTSKVKENTELGFDFAKPDVAGLGEIFAGVGTAERKDDVITGTVDVTSVKKDAGLLGESNFDGVDAAAGKAVPYEATLDDEGRLNKLVLDMPKAGDTPAGKWTLDITGYGAATAQTEPPAAEVTEAPDTVYESLGS